MNFSRLLLPIEKLFWWIVNVLYSRMRYTYIKPVVGNRIKITSGSFSVFDCYPKLFFIWRCEFEKGLRGKMKLEKNRWNWLSERNGSSYRLDFCGLKIFVPKPTRNFSPLSFEWKIKNMNAIAQCAGIGSYFGSWIKFFCRCWWKSDSPPVCSNTVDNMYCHYKDGLRFWIILVCKSKVVAYF